MSYNAATPRRRRQVLSPRVEDPSVLTSSSEAWSGVGCSAPSGLQLTPSQPPRAATSSTLNSKCRHDSDTSPTLNSICRIPLEVGRRSEGHLPPGGGRHDHGNARSLLDKGAYSDTHGTRGEGAPPKEGPGSSVPPLTPETGARTSPSGGGRLKDTLAHRHARVRTPKSLLNAVRAQQNPRPSQQETAVSTQNRSMQITALGRAPRGRPGKFPTKTRAPRGRVCGGECDPWTRGGVRDANSIGRGVDVGRKQRPPSTPDCLPIRRLDF